MGDHTPDAQREEAIRDAARDDAERRHSHAKDAVAAMLAENCTVDLTDSIWAIVDLLDAAGFRVDCTRSHCSEGDCPTPDRGI